MNTNRKPCSQESLAHLGRFMFQFGALAFWHNLSILGRAADPEDAGFGVDRCGAASRGVACYGTARHAEVGYGVAGCGSAGIGGVALH